MKAYISLDLSRNDGSPDNSALQAITALNRYGIIPSATCIQECLLGVPVLMVRATLPEHFERLLVAAELACDLFITRDPDEPPKPHKWRVTPDGFQSIALAA